VVGANIDHKMPRKKVKILTPRRLLNKKGGSFVYFSAASPMHRTLALTVPFERLSSEAQIKYLQMFGPIKFERWY